MDNGSQRENERHRADHYKPAQGQWLMPPQPSMKQIMALMAERDAAIHERNMALSERKAAIAERDMAFLQRDGAIAEKNNAILERDNAMATLQYQENSMASGNVSACPPGCQFSHGMKHVHHPQQHLQHVAQVSETQYNSREMQISEGVPMSPVSPDVPKSRRGKRPKEPKAAAPNKRTSKSLQKIKRESEDPNTSTLGKSREWKNGQDVSGGSDGHSKQVVVKSDWKDQDLGLNQVAFDETTMPPPVCSCTGVFRQCYKWGNGGWQSACCTTSISMYPLPAVPNKRHARIGGRKMSGGAYGKLLSRLAAEGHDLSQPVDLKNHWARHGTNRYITIK